MMRYVFASESSKFGANLGHAEGHVLHFRNTGESLSLMPPRQPARIVGNAAHQCV